jgi:hypothetical protein
VSLLNHILIAKHYNKIDFNNWRDCDWWKNEEWRNFIPTEEHDRIDKYRNQACKAFNKGNMEGHQFIEILEMIDLKKIGYKWLHANYNLFKEPGPNSKVYFPGTEKIKQIIGRYKIDSLHNIASTLVIRPTEPDLFAYKKNQNEDNYDMMFIECKRKDKLSKTQLIGFELIKKHLNIPIIVVQYFERYGFIQKLWKTSALLGSVGSPLHILIPSDVHRSKKNFCSVGAHPRVRPI